ncbi:MAG: alpha/beta hydrolase [Rhodoferax sp.]
MDCTVQQHKAYAYTGGKPFDATLPVVVLLHGALGDHSVWILQSRYLAHHGYAVLAPDLPGHCRSHGAPPDSVEAAADWVLALLDAVGVQQAALVGHSWGSLIALEAAARAPQRVTHLALVGTAFPMRVAPALLQSSQDDPEAAIRMINVFSRSTLCAPPSALGPGTWVWGTNTALNRRVLRSNPKHNVFYAGFKACDQYRNGLEAMAAVRAPVLFVLGAQDQMTPPKAAQSLIAAAHDARVVTLPCGHHQLTEAPEPLLRALVDFLRA